jgi:hypothetical protein
VDEAQTAPVAVRPPRRRPLGVIIVTVGLVLTGLSAYLVAAAALLGGTVLWTDVPMLGETSNVVALSPVPGPIVGAASIAVGTMSLVVAVGFARLRSWGWTGLMLLAAVTLTINLVAVVLGNPNEGSMAVAVAAVFYANQRRIQLLFRGEQVTAFEPARTTDVRIPG